jgi:hypothetical protein
MIDADIAFAGPVCAGPPPDLAEHLSVEILDEFFAQEITTSAAKCPLLTMDNILLLRRVEFRGGR